VKVGFGDGGAVEITTSAAATRLATSARWRDNQLSGIGRA
jgi:hypothetical protein